MQASLSEHYTRSRIVTSAMADEDGEGQTTEEPGAVPMVACTEVDVALGLEVGHEKIREQISQRGNQDKGKKVEEVPVHLGSVVEGGPPDLDLHQEQNNHPEQRGKVETDPMPQLDQARGAGK
jgi:hypothetical protein